MNLPINKQTVLITGAGRGLGSSISKSFHREGANVIINYRKSYESAKRLRMDIITVPYDHMASYCGHFVCQHHVTFFHIVILIAPCVEETHLFSPSS